MTERRPRAGAFTRRGLIAGTGAAALAMPALFRTRPARAAIHADAGEMLMLGFAGRSAAAGPAATLAGHIAAGHAGGALFLADNIGSRDDVLGLTGLFGDAAGGRFPLIAVDHEGGRVQRLTQRQGVSRLPAALSVAATRTPAEAEALYRAAGTQLAALGFTLNLAPVVDLHDPANPTIGRARRAFSADPEVVTAYAAACIDGYAAAGILTAIKHFPGHGLSGADSHDGPVDVTWSWRPEELEPFALLVRSGKPQIVMAGHLAHLLLGERPASLSGIALDGLLRGWFGFTGPIMSDALDMDAITDVYGQREAVLGAIEAGCDIVLISNTVAPNPDLPVDVACWIAAAVAEGRIAPDRIAQSADRVRRLKRACIASA